jgi:hypothetical protein
MANGNPFTDSFTPSGPSAKKMLKRSREQVEIRMVRA